ncbi:hypothetical protein ABE137_25280 [Brevibacillus laterosporus]|uniref:Uncharacterized protein n=1 Tax=Brevibacillus halotolerans TaxID=1507437 RepID=A0ABT4I426_9BACL|nr:MULTISPECIES: hypothetical protein [Brevibacillus]MCR8987559.1 hypothetical protein [Brevibacillus laterosporus]MCZ0833297.1 hypothetical protein [Brevibacillus halotolerans]GIO03052.1 hypothetical protein J5TS2_37200 [Brevibacillus halotolerans]
MKKLILSLLFLSVLLPSILSEPEKNGLEYQAYAKNYLDDAGH